MTKRPRKPSKPLLTAEIEFRAWATDGKLRLPSFKGLRDPDDNSATGVENARGGTETRTARHYCDGDQQALDLLHEGHQRIVADLVADMIDTLIDVSAQDDASLEDIERIRSLGLALVALLLKTARGGSALVH